MKNEELLFIIGAVFVGCAAILYMSGLESVAPYVLSVGAGLFVLFNFGIASAAERRRSRRNYFLPALFFIAAAYFMFRHQNSWILMLALAALLETYAVFRENN